MSTIYARRSERIALRRQINLVVRDPHGQAGTEPATTFAVSCHGCGVFAKHDLPMGTEVFVVDNYAGVGAWGRLVWEGRCLRDGRLPLGVEFYRPRNYWGHRLVPRSWRPYLATRELPALLLGRDGVLVTNRAREALQLMGSPALPGEACCCCGNREGVAVLAIRPEPLCKVCRSWVV